MDTRLEDKPVQKTLVPDEPPLPLPSKEVGRHVLAFRRFSRFSLTPLNLRRWRNFKANRRGYWSLWVFLGLFVFSLFAEFIANDKPIIAVYKGEALFPVLVDYPESKFGGFLAVTDYKDPVILDEIRKQYVLTAQAKGLGERQVLYGHVFRNAMLLIIAGFPGAFIHAFFSGALLIETIFSLDGLGLLSFESVINRDYPVVFANIYIFAMLGLAVNLVSDFIYTLVDPRIDFETREV